jgi:hypothetical protein
LCDTTEHHKRNRYGIYDCQKHWQDLTCGFTSKIQTLFERMLQSASVFTVTRFSSFQFEHQFVELFLIDSIGAARRQLGGILHFWESDDIPDTIRRGA